MRQHSIYTLENDDAVVRVSDRGAELQSVIAAGLERIWCGDPEVWHRRAPLLFPIVGRLKDGWYVHEGKRIEAPMHGFCRDRAFEAEQSSPSCLRFSTQTDDDTRAVFPFDFFLQVEYELDGCRLIKRHVVENRGAAPMPFELGGHEAYSTRLLPEDSMADYFIDFGPDAVMHRYEMDADGILGLPLHELPLESGRLRHTPEQLGLDTIVTQNVPANRVRLASRAHDHAVIIEFADFPYLGIWTMGGQEDARYICIEPWSALPDTHFSPRELGARPGVCTLAPHERIELVYTMIFE